jgi:hypothetical protein
VTSESDLPLSYKSRVRAVRFCQLLLLFCGPKLAARMNRLRLPPGVQWARTGFKTLLVGQQVQLYFSVLGMVRVGLLILAEMGIIVAPLLVGWGGFVGAEQIEIDWTSGCAAEDFETRLQQNYGCPTLRKEREGWGTRSFVAEPNLDKSG